PFLRKRYWVNGQPLQKEHTKTTIDYDKKNRSVSCVTPQLEADSCTGEEKTEPHVSLIQSRINSSKRRINEIFYELFSIEEEIDENKPFFEFGVTSINVVSFVVELEKQLQITLDVTDVFNYPTIQKFAEYIETQFQSKADKCTEEETERLVPIKKEIMGENKFQQVEQEALELETILTKVHFGALDIEEALGLIK
ncbi:MAG: hypothetical protein GY928_39405, partial [Colwellia sp.]|nr:hypothetical protein [Colwellia sp.]